MRIDKLHIASFKNLRDFSINYDQGSLITVLVGRNGTGKSNLLEALVIIFRDLDLGEGPAFKYSINYKCRNNEIVVDADPDRAQREAYRIQVNSEAISIRNFSGMPDRQYLPNYVFGYYSGPSNRLEQHFEKHQNKFYDELLKGNDKALRPLLYARLAHSQFALLAFFNEHDEAIMKFLDTQLRIQALDSVLFVMRQPPWKSRKGMHAFGSQEAQSSIFSRDCSNYPLPRLG